MKNNLFIKGISMIAVLGAMVFWGCSQDEEIEEQVEWSKKAVKKSLARSKYTFNENIYFTTFFICPGTKYGEIIDAAYNVNLTIECDTDYHPVYTYKADFAFPGPFNPPLTNEKVSVEGSEWNEFHNIELKIEATYYGTTVRTTYQTTIPIRIP